MHALFASILQAHGVAPAPATVRCPACGGMTRFADAPCERCGETGVVPACATCEAEPQDPLFAPCCSGACREAWERRQRAPVVRKAP